MNIFKRIFASLRLREAIKLANSRYYATRRRQFVMPAAHGKLLILDRANFRKLKQKHYIASNVFCADLLNECFYHTPNADGSGVIPEAVARRKRLQYFNWLDSMLNMPS